MDGATVMPGPASSPWIRRYPHDWFSRASRSTRWAMRWKPALNAFAITFGDRFPAAETY